MYVEYNYTRYAANPQAWKRSIGAAVPAAQVYTPVLPAKVG